MKKFYASLAALAVVVSGVLLLNFLGGVSNASAPTDCDNNAIIKCGALSASELKKKYDANATGDLDNIYHAYGLTDTDMENAGTRAVMGAVHKDGRVTVGSETVATNLLTIGRQNMSGSHNKSIGGKTYYERTPSVSFRNESISAFVFMDANGEFRAAVMTACGNPVHATPKPKPVYTCDGIGAVDITRTEYRFTANASAKNGATITGYTFDFGDGTTKTQTSNVISHDFVKEGTYTVKVTANVKVGSTTKTATNQKCQMKVPVAPAPAYTCDSLSATKISGSDKGYTFNGKATATGGATITGYTFDFGDGKQQTATSATNVSHTYDAAGTYTVAMTVTVKVGAETKSVSGPQCTTQVTIAPPEECKPGIPKGDVRCTPEECKPGIPVGDERCNECKPGIPAGDERCTECKPGVPTGSAECTPVQECKPGVPMGSEECTPCDVPGKENLPKNSVDCVETPVELPHTGTGSLLGAGVGLGSLIAAGSYYFMSRRGLLAELLKR